MLTIRLSRVGKKKQPSYRIVVQDKRHDPWSPAIEVIGHFDPRSKGEQLKLDEEKVKHWLSKGAQPSETIHNMLVEKKLVKGEKIHKMHLTKKRRAKLAQAKAKAEEASKKAAEAPVETPVEAAA
jgi:small subunit ribosomal protein S16